MLYCRWDMESVIQGIQNSFKKRAVVDVRSGDTVRVHQRVREGNKERVQIFQGLVIRTVRKGSHTSSITVSRIEAAEAAEEALKEETSKEAEAKAAEEAKAAAKLEAKAAAVQARHEAAGK
jgi:large subunit ribosomal protein L19